jgi:hypothetical protein
MVPLGTGQSSRTHDQHALDFLWIPRRRQPGMLAIGSVLVAQTMKVPFSQLSHHWSLASRNRET